MERAKEVLTYFFAAMAVLSLLLAISEAMRRSLGSAAILLIATAVAAGLAYLPKMEVFKVAWVEFRLRNTLDRAEEVIERLKQIAAVNAKITYLSMAYENRLASPPAREKQALLNEVDQQLQALNVSDDERREIALPIVQFIGVDLYNFYSRVMERFLRWKNEDLVRRLNATQSDELQEERNKLLEGETKWREAKQAQNPFYDLGGYDLSSYLRVATPSSLMTDSELASAERFRGEIQRLYESSRAKGGYTAEAAEFFDQYVNKPAAVDIKTQQVFGVSIP